MSSSVKNRIATGLGRLFTVLAVFGPGLAAGQPLVVFGGNTQGTSYQVKYRYAQQRHLKKEVDSLLQAIDRALSTYNPASEISVFNRSHALRFQSPYFYPVLQKSQEVYSATDGLFDPTVMPLVSAYGFGPVPKKAGEAFSLDSVMQLVGFDNILFDAHSVRKKKEGVALDFNAIAQGYTVDVLVGFLQKQGISDFMVEVGGELRAGGYKQDKTLWTVGIADPLRPSRLRAKVKLENRAMATSGNYRNYRERNGVRYNHIINPRTGEAGESDILSVTVFAADAMTADAYATAFILMGFEKMKRFLKGKQGLDVYAVHSLKNGNVVSYASGAQAQYLEELPEE